MFNFNRFRFKFKDLNGRTSGGSAIGDTIVRMDTLFGIVRACVRNLIVVADVDCRMSAQLKDFERRKTYCQDVRVQYYGDPRAREHRRLAWP